MNKKYIIGLSPRYVVDKEKEFLKVSTDYIKALSYDSVIPVILSSNENILDELKICDAFVILGGDDIDPSYYNETNELNLSHSMNSLIDKIDKQILEYAIDNKLPLLGICRGMQCFGAFMNGSLYQDLDYFKVDHPLTEEHLHSVTKVNDFGLSKYLPSNFSVNSYHHQAINNMPDGFVLLYKNNETIEAIEHETLPLLGVQWHPERHYTEESKIIFDYFINKIIDE